MRSFIRLTITALILTGTCVFTANAQSVLSSRKYRVTAFKKGDNSVQSLSNTTEVNPYMTIFIPNSFTPNGDGLNDTFGVYGESIKQYSMEIYNRWGEKVFESVNINDQWDGTYNGKSVPEGTYVYKVTAQEASGNNTSRNGTVNIIY